LLSLHQKHLRELLPQLLPNFRLDCLSNLFGVNPAEVDDRWQNQQAGRHRRRCQPEQRQEI